MGKCKKRTLYKSNSCVNLSRDNALDNIQKTMVRKSINDAEFKEVVNMISLFGFSAEELSEAGVPYENLRALGTLIS